VSSQVKLAPRNEPKPWTLDPKLDLVSSQVKLAPRNEPKPWTLDPKLDLIL